VQVADALHPGDERVAGLEVQRRVAEGADPGRRAGEDHVTGQQRAHGGDARATSSATEKTMSEVRPFCMTRPLRLAADLQIVGVIEGIGG